MNTRVFVAIATCMGLTGLPALTPVHAAPAYAVVTAQSSLGFTATQQGERFSGTFRDYDARIAYAPDDLAGSVLDVVVRVKSIDTKSPDRDQALATADWFDFGKFSTATFRTVAIRVTPSGPVGDADLTIKGHTKRIAFPFTWSPTAAGATLDAHVTLDRLDFGLGTGEWADESAVGRKVDVVVHLTLTAAASRAPTPAAAPARP